MADAREITATAIRDARKQELPPDAVAMLVDGRLHAAGFRILGPDEVDPVTLEKVLVAVNEIAQRGYSAAYRGGAMDCDAAIRALGRKA